jgi:DNA gyrase inhibitor GyrI
MIVKTLPDISAWSVKTRGVSGSGKAFNFLESKLPTLKGQKFYGVLSGDPKTGVYRACVVKNNQRLKDIESLEEWIIPGGKYITEKIIGWARQTKIISQTFKRLSCVSEVDNTRPQIEFYRSQKELIVMFPIK